jgi:hypothetical protein
MFPDRPQSINTGQTPDGWRARRERLLGGVVYQLALK